MSDNSGLDESESGSTRPNMIWALIFAALVMVSIGAAAKRFELQHARKADAAASQSTGQSTGQSVSLTNSQSASEASKQTADLSSQSAAVEGDEAMPAKTMPQGWGEDNQSGSANQQPAKSASEAALETGQGWHLDHSFGSATIPKSSSALPKGSAEKPLETALLPSPERFGDETSDVREPVVSLAVPLTPETSAKLAEHLDAVPFDLAAVREQDLPVPRIAVSSLPSDINQLEDPEARKALFQRILLPLILISNEKIGEARARAEELLSRQADGKSISAADQAWLDQQIEAFGATDQDDLMTRLDILPVGLVMAQGIQESGWGTSRFAQEGNALFGQRTWNDDQPGMVPEDIGEGEAFRVRKFDSLLDAVKSYMHNLNSHDSYAELRKIRTAMANDVDQPDTKALVGGLQSYSEEGDLYIKRLRQLIAENNLDVFDKASLWPLTEEGEAPATIGEDEQRDDASSPNEG
ncbi:MAG: glucosaminidase domain-containing protein [Pseudomonadota bacterium]